MGSMRGRWRGGRPAAQGRPAEGGAASSSATRATKRVAASIIGGIPVGDDGLGVDRIVCQLLVSIAVRQYPSQPAIVLGAIFDETGEFAVNTPMGLRDLARAADDEGLGSVKRRVIGRSCCRPGEGKSGDHPGFVEISSSPDERGLGFGRHRSTPSRRTSAMKPVRS